MPCSSNGDPNIFGMLVKVGEKCAHNSQCDWEENVELRSMSNTAAIRDYERISLDNDDLAEIIGQHARCNKSADAKQREI